MGGYIIAGLVSIGFIAGANGLNAWIPTLSNPHDFNMFIVADTIVPILILVAVLTILCFVNRKKGLSQKKYLASSRSFSGALTITIVMLAIAGAVVGAYSSTSAASTASSSVTVSLVNGAFNPSNAQGHFVPATIIIVIGVNNTVTWTSNDYTIHTVTSDSSIFGSGLLNNGNSWSHTFTASGTYSYHCAIHPYMNGTVIVVAKS